MNISITRYGLKSFSDNEQLKKLLEGDREAFKVLVLETFPECPVTLVTLCWPHERQSVFVSRGLSYSIEDSFPVIQWGEHVFNNKKLWSQIFKWAKGSLVPLERIPFSIFDRGFEDHQYQSRFAPRLDDRFFISYALPKSKKSFERFLAWVTQSSEELKEYFAWPLDKFASENDSEAERFHSLFLNAPKKLWDNSGGKPKIIEDNLLSKPIEAFLKEELAKLDQEKERLNFKISSSQFEKLPCIFPVWVSSAKGAALTPPPLFYAKGEGARSWAEICAFRAKFIRASEAPLFYEVAKMALPELENAFLLDRDIDANKLAFNPIEELRFYLDTMQEKYSVLKRALSNNIFTEAQ